MFVCEATQTTGCADPYAALAVYGQRNDPIVRQAVTRCVSNEPIAVDAVETVDSDDPHAGVLVLIDRDDAVTGQAILHCVFGDCAVLVASQAFGRTDPERTFSICKQSLDSIPGKLPLGRREDALYQVHDSVGCRHPERAIVIFA